MTFFEAYGKEIVSLVVPIIIWMLNFIFKDKAKLLFATPHQFTFLVQEPLYDTQGTLVSSTQTVRTSSYVINNAGKQSASKIEVVFNWKPMCLNLWPVRHYEEHVESDDRYVLIFDSLAPAEVIGIEVLSVNSELPLLLTVRSSECIAQTINMYPQPVVSKFLRMIGGGFVVLGFAASIYLFIVLIQFLVLKTPFGH